MTTLPTSKVHYQGFYSKYPYNQASRGQKEILYDGPMINVDSLFNNYGLRLSIVNQYKFIIIYKTKKP